MECKWEKSMLLDYSTPWINRYIMECKWGSTGHFGKVGWELIDTLWNVNIYNPDSVQIHISN